MPNPPTPRHCPLCQKWHVPTPGMENTSCCVLHAPGTCCHYSDTEVPAPTPTVAEAREPDDYAEVLAMVQRVRDFLGDAPDDLPFSRTVQDPTPWGTMEARQEETELTSADLRAMCDVVEVLAVSRRALLSRVREAVEAESARWVERIRESSAPPPSREAAEVAHLRYTQSLLAALDAIERGEGA